MIVDGREIVFTEHFFDQLADIQSYNSVYSARQARQLSTDIVNFITDCIAPNPYMFVAYEGLKTPDKAYRRATFRRMYGIIYKVSLDKIDVLTIYHNSRNPDAIDLGESS